MATSFGATGAIAAALGALVLSGARVAPAQDAGPLDAARRLAEQSGRDGMAAALSAALHPGAVVVWPGAPVAVGTEARRLLAAQSSLDSLQLTLQPVALELSADSACAAGWGLAIATPRRVAGPPRLGRFIGVWSRRANVWRLSAIMLSGVVPPAATVVPAGLARRRPLLSAQGPAAPFAIADLAFARLAADSGAVVAFSRFAAPHAMMLDVSGLVVRGPESIGALVAGPSSWRWHPVAGDGAASGDLGWTVGEAVITPPPGEGPPAHSKYLTVWRRLGDGSIRFLTDGGNPRPAP